jgi:hypothetical protein
MRPRILRVPDTPTVSRQAQKSKRDHVNQSAGDQGRPTKVAENSLIEIRDPNSPKSVHICAAYSITQKVRL